MADIEHERFIDVVPIMPCPKFIVDNGLGDLWRRKSPNFSKLIHYNGSSSTGSRRYRVYNDIKIAK